MKERDAFRMKMGGDIFGGEGIEAWGLKMFLRPNLIFRNTQLSDFSLDI